MSEEKNGDYPPATMYEWANMVAKLAHVRIGPPKESHDVTVFTEDGKPVLEGPIYQSVDIEFGTDAMIESVNFDPPNPPKPGDDLALHPHGRLTVTVGVFLDGPIPLGKRSADDE